MSPGKPFKQDRRHETMVKEPNFHIASLLHVVLLGLFTDLSPWGARNAVRTPFSCFTLEQKKIRVELEIAD
jgi:hypothetical protein